MSDSDEYEVVDIWPFGPIERRKSAPAPDVQGTITWFKWPREGHCAGDNFGAVVQGVTVIGKSETALRRGDRIRASGGKFDDHVQWGRQYRAATVALLPPVDHDERARLLQMGGVPPQTAKRLIAHFRADLFSILKGEPERLAELPRIKQPTRDKILRVINRFADELLLQFLLRAGVASTHALKIAEAKSFKAVQARPYILSHDPEFGTVDKIARELLEDRFEEFGLERVLGAIVWLLRKAKLDGNCGISFIKLRNILQRDFAFRPEVIAEAASGRNYRIKNIADYAPGIELTVRQIAALKTALMHPVSIITGGPGTGKTTILKVLAHIAGIENIQACALAGLAALRIKNATGIVATTIHRAIKMCPGGKRFADYDPDEFCIETDFLVVDECSMIDTYHFQKLLDECSPSTRIVLVGDIDQLVPIAAGQPFADLIAGELFPVTRLDRVFRFAEGGAIAEAARAINHDDVNAIVDGSLNCDEFEFVPCAEPLAAR